MEILKNAPSVLIARYEECQAKVKAGDESANLLNESMVLEKLLKTNRMGIVWEALNNCIERRFEENQDLISKYEKVDFDELKAEFENYFYLELKEVIKKSRELPITKSVRDSNLSDAVINLKKALFKLREAKTGFDIKALFSSDDIHLLEQVDILAQNDQEAKVRYKCYYAEIDATTMLDKLIEEVEKRIETKGPDNIPKSSNANARYFSVCIVNYLKEHLQEPFYSSVEVLTETFFPSTSLNAQRIKNYAPIDSHLPSFLAMIIKHTSLSREIVLEITDHQKVKNRFTKSAKANIVLPKEMFLEAYSSKKNKP